MSKLNNLVQKATNTSADEEEASAKYSGMTGTPEIKKWYADEGEDVYINSDSLRLHGKRFKNSGSDYALVCHGYTSKAKHMAGFVKKFYDRGFNVLAVDARAHGDSEGAKIGMGLLRAQGHSRVDKAHSLMGSRRADNPARCVHGRGDGAHGIGRDAARKCQGRYRGLRLQISEWDEFIWEAETLHIPWFPVLNAASLLSKLRDGYDFKQASALDQVKKSRIPTLFIHGSEDELVPYKNARRAIL